MMNKSKKREILMPVVVLFILLLAVPVVFAGFSDMWNKITGWATSEITTVSISVGNNAPILEFVSAIPAQSVTESGTASVVFSFTATDIDGVGNLNDNLAQARFQRAGETTRENLSCAWVSDIDTDTANYTCTIDIWYWDGAGSWTINATIEDINNAKGENSSTTFTLQETTAMVMSPIALTWPTINLTDTNVLSNNDPVTINNTANKDITAGNVKVAAIDLQGETTSTDFIYANNFSVNVNDACEGTVMVNNTATAVSGATITAGNNSAGQGQEELYSCLEGMLQTISAQTYSTAGLGSWTISVS